MKIKGLRVVDASVMPIVPTGNTNVPVMMVAEKASDIIKSTIKCHGHSESWEEPESDWEDEPHQPEKPDAEYHDDDYEWKEETDDAWSNPQNDADHSNFDPHNSHLKTKKDHSWSHSSDELGNGPPKPTPWNQHNKYLPTKGHFHVTPWNLELIMSNQQTTLNQLMSANSSSMVNASPQTSTTPSQSQVAGNNQQNSTSDMTTRLNQLRMGLQQILDLIFGTRISNAASNSTQPNPPTNSMQPNPPLNSMQPNPPANSMQPNPPMNSMQPNPPANSMQPNPQMNSMQPNLPTNSMQPNPPMNPMKPNPPANSMRPNPSMNSVLPSPPVNSMQPPINPSNSAVSASFPISVGVLKELKKLKQMASCDEEFCKSLLSFMQCRQPSCQKQAEFVGYMYSILCSSLVQSRTD